MHEVTEIILRGIVAFVFLILLGPMIGKQLISQNGYLPFIGAITLGSVAGNLIFNIKIRFGYFLLSMAVFSTIILAFSYIAMKSSHTRKWVNGEPRVLIEKGKILENQLKKSLYTQDMLEQGLRKKDVFDLNEVEYAILETDGSLSVIKKAPTAP
ncbi:DUF421 domain-containing protein [Cohnella candidum]|uniref:DUF421 domain-containing protein n=1 Tax=Cohnella candidum TaxID=2674991 RepID=A0A3G3JXQ1_9BACL|nr:YetF domain-containing protein [Cohnella candidum]AYQ73004.1 DUF421 domain-containing protein [Cohnella candidum]